MKTAYSYVRFSALGKQEVNDSVRRQTESAKQWCKLNGYALAEQNFFDKGVSAYKGDNLKAEGALRRFIQLHQEGKIPRGSLLCLDSVDRFSRLPVSQSTAYFLEVINAGIGLVFTGSYDKRVITASVIDKEPFILQTIIGELIRSTKESEEKSRKVREGLAAKKAKIQAGVIQKYNNVPKYFSFDESKGRYVHNENTKLVREMVDGILAGKSLYEISTDFNKRGIPTIRRKLEWSPSSVRQILKNRCLIGEYAGNKGYVPPIIDETTFNKVQNILNNNATNRGRKGALVNIFRSLAFCAECGRAMNQLSGTWKGVPYRYFRCSNYGRKDSCTKSYLRADELERDFFFNYLYQGKGKLINEEDIAEVKTMQKEIATKTARQNQVKASIDKLLTLIDATPMEELKAQLTKLGSERETLKREIDELNAKAVAVQEGPKDLGKWLLKEVRFENSKGEIEESVIYRNTGKGKLHPEDEVLMYSGNLSKLEEALKDNELRERLRVSLPTILSKVTMDSKGRKLAVFNRAGRLVYQSREFASQNNNSERWRASLKTWTKRKTAGGRVITCKRKVAA